MSEELEFPQKSVFVSQCSDAGMTFPNLTPKSPVNSGASVAVLDCVVPEDVLSLASEAEHAVRQMIPDKTRTRAENVNIVFMSFRYVVENSLLLRLLFPDSVLHDEFTKCFPRKDITILLILEKPCKESV